MAEPGCRSTDDHLDHKALFEIHRKAMAQAIHKAMAGEPSIDWLLENQDSITHKYYQMGLGRQNLDASLVGLRDFLNRCNRMGSPTSRVHHL